MTPQSHSDRAHARLSPSASHRWLNCPGSIKLGEMVPPRIKNEAADEGTAAHMLAEQCLASEQEPAEFLDRCIDVREGVKIPVTEEMVEGVQLYVDYVRERISKSEFWLVEKRLDMSHIAEGIFGTVDFLAFVRGEESNYTLYIVDFKFGRNEVTADENPQLGIYASGALAEFKDRVVKDVCLVVVQPRHGGIKEWWTTASKVRGMEDIFRDAAWDIDIFPDKHSPGEWCRWCPGAGVCPEFRSVALEAARVEFAEDGTVTAIPDVSSFSAAQLAKALDEIKIVEAYVKQVKDYALAEAKEGRTPPGWKLVPTRPRRRWVSEDDARFVLASVFDLDDDTIAPRKLVSPAQIEKIIGRGKQAKAQLAALAEKHSANVTLAPLSDSREPVQADAFTEFTSEE